MEIKGNKGQLTRERLLEAALQQFTAHGYHGASMRQIADAAGVAVGGIYNHFSSKEEILKAVILAYHPINLVLPGLAKSEGGTLEVLLHNAATQFMAVLANRPELLNLFLIELFEFKGAHLPDLFDVLLPKVMTFSQRLVTVDPRLRPLPPMTIIRIFIGTLLGFYISGVVLNQLPAPYAQQLGTVDDLVTILVHGLLQHSDEHATNPA